MPQRNTGQGKRCRVCAELDQMWLQATHEEEKTECAQRKHKHIQDIKAMRAVGVRGNLQSVYDSRAPSPDGLGLVCKIMIDGMDQAKFKCPRNS
eukprot:10765205-Karenia_brevis.AAC.1